MAVAVGTDSFKRQLLHCHGWQRNDNQNKRNNYISHGNGKYNNLYPSLLIRLVPIDYILSN